MRKKSFISLKQYQTVILNKYALSILLLEFRQTFSYFQKERMNGTVTENYIIQALSRENASLGFKTS